MADLGDYLRICGSRRREAGVYDCATFPADWAVLRDRPDPMARWRSAYRSEEAAGALIAGAGGLAALFAAGMAAAGIPEVSDPEAGDIGIVRFSSNEAGAIFSGRRWIFAAERGIVGASLDRDQIARIWRP